MYLLCNYHDIDDNKMVDKNKNNNDKNNDNDDDDYVIIDNKDIENKEDSDVQNEIIRIH